MRDAVWDVVEVRDGVGGIMCGGVGVVVMVGKRVCGGVQVLVREGLGVDGAVALTVREIVGEVVPVEGAVRLREPLRVVEEVGPIVTVADKVTVWLLLGLKEGVREGLAETEGVSGFEAVAVSLMVIVRVRGVVSEAVEEVVAVGLFEKVPVPDAEAEAVMLTVHVWVCVWICVAVGVVDTKLEEVGLHVPVDVGDAVDDREAVMEEVLPMVCVTLSVGVVLGRSVMETDGVGVRERFGVSEQEQLTLRVLDVVGLGMAVAVILAVSAAVKVVAVVEVCVAVGVRVRLGVGLGFGLNVAVGLVVLVEPLLLLLLGLLLELMEEVMLEAAVRVTVGVMVKLLVGEPVQLPLGVPVRLLV